MTATSGTAARTSVGCPRCSTWLDIATPAQAVCGCGMSLVDRGVVVIAVVQPKDFT